MSNYNFLFLKKINKHEIVTWRLINFGSNNHPFVWNWRERMVSDIPSNICGCFNNILLTVESNTKTNFTNIILTSPKTQKNPISKETHKQI